jgi:hypothetical protein
VSMTGPIDGHVLDADAANPPGRLRDDREGASCELLGRAALIKEIKELLRLDRNVLLFGLAGVGKTALIDALRGVVGARAIVVLDPFEHVTPRVAATVRRGMDRGTRYLAATRSLGRAELGAVRRIAWRFETVRVRPLEGHALARFIRRECEIAGLPPILCAPAWQRAIAQLTDGRPGLVLATLRAGICGWRRRGVLASPQAAYIEAMVTLAGFSIPDPR